MKLSQTKLFFSLYSAVGLALLTVAVPTMAVPMQFELDANQQLNLGVRVLLGTSPLTLTDQIDVSGTLFFDPDANPGEMIDPRSTLTVTGTADLLQPSDNLGTASLTLNDVGVQLSSSAVTPGPSPGTFNATIQAALNSGTVLGAFTGTAAATLGAPSLSFDLASEPIVLLGDSLVTFQQPASGPAQVGIPLNVDQALDFGSGGPEVRLLVSGQLNFSAVPEPHILALLGIAGLVALGRNASRDEGELR